MDLVTFGWLMAGIGVAWVWVSIYLIIVFILTQTLASRSTNSDYIMQQIFRVSATNLVRSIFATTIAAFSALGIALLRLLRNIYEQRLFFNFSTVVFIAMLTMYFLQVPATETAIVMYQTVVSPSLHKFVYPLGNILIMLSHIVIAGLNWVVQVFNFLIFGVLKIILGCLFNQDLYTLFLSFMDFLFAISFDLVTWIAQNPFIARYDITNTVSRAGLFLTQTTGVGNCTCAAVFFIYEDAVKLVNSPEFIVTSDALVNAVVSLLQKWTPLPLLFGQTAFTFEPFATEAPVALNGLGDVIILSIKLLANSVYGFFDSQNQLPADAQDFLSQPLLQPGTQLISAIIITSNITWEAVTHPYPIYTSSATGLPYFQFGKVIDRLRLVVRTFGSYFVLLGPNIVGAVTDTLLIPVELTGAVTEIIPQLIYYIFYPPIQNPLKFLLIYYSTPGNYLLNAFLQAYLASDSIGIAVGLLNTPLGDALTSGLGSVISLIQIGTQIIFYSYNLFGFVNATPTYTDIDTDTFFANLLLLNEALGDNVRQFDENFCFDVIKQEYTQNTTICAYAIAQTATIDVLISLTLQITLFVKTLLAAFALNLSITTVDIPEFDEAIHNAELAGCGLSRAILLLIPLELPCQFDSGANELCDTGQTCAATVLCEIWETLLALLRIANDFFIKLRSGDQFDTYTEFFGAAIRMLLEDATKAFNSLGALLDCLICRVTNPNGLNCESIVFTLFETISNALKAIIPFVTEIFFDVLKLILTFIKNLFVDGNIIKAITDFFIGVFDLIIKIVKSLFAFIIKFFDDIGLGFIASVLRVFDRAFCNVVYGIIWVLNKLGASSVSVYY
jgi:hypothetical protein